MSSNAIYPPIGGDFTGTVTVTNFPANQAVTVTNFPVTQPVSGTLEVEGVTADGAPATENPLLVGALDGLSGNKSTLQTIPFSGLSPLVIADLTRPQGGTPVAAIINGVGQQVSAPTDQINAQVIYFSISGTFTGTLEAQYNDGVGVQGIPVRAVGNPGTQSQITSGGIYIVEGVDPQFVQLVATAWTSGAAGVVCKAVTALTGLYTNQAGDWAVSVNNFPSVQAVNGSVSVSNFPATQPVSGTITANQGGTWNTGRTWVIASGTDSVSAVQSGTWNINNVSGTVSLPTGASSAALQTTGNTTLSTINGKVPSLGQATMANSTPVAIASNQSAIPVTGTFFQTTQPVSGTVTVTQATGANLHVAVDSLPSIPTGANTIGAISNTSFTATQATGTNLHTVVDNFPASQPTTITKVSLTASAPTSVSVGVASGVILAANASRKGAVFTNLSSARISFNLAAGAAVLNSGITLLPGGVFVMDEYTFTNAAVNGIASVAASALSVQEFA